MKKVTSIISGVALIFCFYAISTADESNFDVNGSNTTYHSSGSQSEEKNTDKENNKSLIDKEKEKIDEKIDKMKT